MKLRKEIWKYGKLNDYMSFKNGFNFNKGNLQNGWKVLGVSDFQNYFYPNYDNLEILYSDKLPNSDYLIQDKDILFVRSNGNKDLVGRTLLIKEPPFPITFSAFCIRGRLINLIVDPLFFTFYTKSDLFKKALKKLVQGTNITNVSQSLLSQLEIPLPPLEEQKQIASLFQSIETAMEHVEGQEKNLKALLKELINGLVSKQPKFGSLLNESNCVPSTIGEIAECDKKYPEHEKEVEKFVGLEDIESENFQLQGFGLVANGTTFTKRFAKGDVLFGKRRAYLRKVAVADFDGICSGDILAIRAKSKKILQALLPFYLSSDAFIQHAVSTSAGSLSPRTKWKDLAELEVCLPDIKTQEKILEVLQQFETTISQLKQQKATLKLLKQKLLNEILG